MKNLKRTFLLLTLILLILLVPTVLFAGGQKEPVIDSYPMMAFEPQEQKATKAVDGEMVEINIFTTNDEHGWIFDWDFGQEGPRMSREIQGPAVLQEFLLFTKNYLQKMIIQCLFHVVTVSRVQFFLITIIL